jgi:hypothetical protein
MPPVPQLVPDPKGPPHDDHQHVPSDPAAGASAGGGRNPRAASQWALGYREPLNKNEENKKNDDGLNVRQRIIDIYSKRGFDSIDLLTCAAGSAASACTPSASPGSAAGRRPRSSRRSWTTATSCCGCGSTAASSTMTS